MSDVAQQLKVKSTESTFSYLTHRTARFGLVAVLLAAVALGIVSLRYGSNEDASRDVRVEAHNAY
jgi:hypothetical protein